MAEGLLISDKDAGALAKKAVGSTVTFLFGALGGTGFVFGVLNYLGVPVSIAVGFGLLFLWLSCIGYDARSSRKRLEEYIKSINEKLSPAGSDEAIRTFRSLSEMQQKIMRTLWRCQNLVYPLEILSKRWTFIISSGLPEYPEFFAAAAELSKLGYTSMNPSNQHWSITDKGILLMSAIGSREAEGVFFII